ncbi:MAG: MBL fold metallo-hydrolase [Treponema sp.]
MDNETSDKTQLRIAFTGAIDTVSGSSTLLEYTNSEKNIRHYYLVDCGEYQEANPNYTENKRRLLKKAKNIRALFLTHAHNDHIGMLPDLIENGFSGKIYSTSPTMELTKVMLEDALRLDGKHGKEIKDIIDRMKFDPIDIKTDFHFGDSKHPVPIDDGLFMYPLRTSHILGSCSFTFMWWKKEVKQLHLEKPEKDFKNIGTIHFSGDVGPCDELSVSCKDAQSIILKDFSTPYYSESNKYIVLESTYGNRVRDKEKLFTKKIEKLTRIIDETKNRGGRVFIPAFALGRMQEVLVDLYYIKQKPRQFTKEYFVENNRTEREVVEYFSPFLHISGSYSLTEFETQLWQKAFPPPDRVKNYLQFNDTALFKDIPEHAQDKIIDVLNTLYRNFSSGMDFEYLYYSPLAHKVSDIYVSTLFSSTMNEKNEIKYHYVSPLFFDSFMLSNDAPDEKLKEEEGKRVLKEALFPQPQKEGHPHNRTKGDLFSKMIAGEYKADVITFANNILNSPDIEKLQDFLADENNTLILTGYQAEGTNGALFKRLAHGGLDARELYNTKLADTDIRLGMIKCGIEDMSAFYSGHADQEQLVEYVHGFDNTRKENTFPTTVFLNHGTRTQREALKTAIESKNNETHKISVLLPESFKWFNLNTGEFEESVADEATTPADDTANTGNKNKITLKDTIDILYPNDFNPALLGKIINAVNDILAQ